jgi:putative alpha-1,2-mannosidase
MNVLEEFKKLFKESDFQGLIKIGAPVDEYDHEASYLYEHIEKTDSVEEIKKKIWDHFYHSFCTGTTYNADGTQEEWHASEEFVLSMIGTQERYHDIAVKIKSLLCQE